MLFLPQTGRAAQERLRLSLQSGQYYNWRMPINRPSFIFVSLLLSCLSIAGFFCLQAVAKEKASYQAMLPKLDTAPPQKTVKLKGRIGHEEIRQTKDVGNPWGYLPFETKLPQVVSVVAPNSPAYHGGLRPMDAILSAEISANQAQLIVERAGKKYSCTLTLNSLQANAKAQPTPEARSLADHEIVLLIDSSASMNTRDCPNNESRWTWCRNQAGMLYNEGKELFKNKINIITFNSEFRSYAKCKVESLEQVFAQNVPAGETNMAPVIDDALSTLNSQLYSGKPAVIAVVTDGRPTDVEPLKAKIKQIANSLRDPSLLTIAFIEIGTPERYLKELDNDLVSQGARADIVTVFPFSAVNTDGLAKTLSKAVNITRAQVAKPTATSPPPPRRPISPPVEEGDDAAPPPPKAAAPAKPSPEQLEKQRVEQEKRAAEESKVRRAAANNSYDFSKAGSQSTAKPKQPAASSSRAPAKPAYIEVDEKESVRRQESNRTYSGAGSRPGK